MVTFRNNNRRPSFRGSNNNRRPTFRRSDDNSKFQSSNFQRKMPTRNNNNAPKLIEKYNDLAREASSSGDKILSENYLQHADHFTRVMNEQDALKKERFAEKITDNKSSVEKNSNKTNDISEDKMDEKVDKLAKSQPEAN